MTSPVSQAGAGRPRGRAGWLGGSWPKQQDRRDVFPALAAGPISLLVLGTDLQGFASHCSTWPDHHML